jgi:protein O-mannosyl-transferase
MIQCASVTRDHMRLAVAMGVGVGLTVTAVFLPALANGFVNLDDGGYLQRLVRPDLVTWAFTSVEHHLWMPVTWLSLWADRAVLGPEQWVPHLVNAVLHGLNAALVFGLALRLWSRTRYVVPCAAAAALLFGVHPLRVESVAWMVERKDMLAGLFVLLATHAHLSWQESRQRRWYVAGLLSFVLALASKPSAIPVPLAWIALDVARRRFAILEKVPYLLASGSMCVVTAFAGQGVARAAHPLYAVLLASYSVCRYLFSTVWPSDLYVLRLYPRPHVILSMPYVAAAVLVTCASIAAILSWRRTRIPAVTWFSFLILLAPNLGFVQAGMQSDADRFTYLASIALLLGVGAGVAALLDRSPRVVPAVTAVSACALVALGFVTVRQIGFWRDTEALWDRVLQIDPDHWHALENRAHLHAMNGRWADAAADLEVAVPQVPWNRELRRRFANYLVRAGRLDDALLAYEGLLETERDPESLMGLSVVLAQLGRGAESRQAMAEALR